MHSTHLRSGCWPKGLTYIVTLGMPSTLPVAPSEPDNLEVTACKRDLFDNMKHTFENMPLGLVAPSEPDNLDGAAHQ